MVAYLPASHHRSIHYILKLKDLRFCPLVQPVRGRRSNVSFLDRQTDRETFKLILLDYAIFHSLRPFLLLLSSSPTSSTSSVPFFVIFDRLLRGELDLWLLLKQQSPSRDCHLLPFVTAVVVVREKGPTCGGIAITEAGPLHDVSSVMGDPFVVSWPWSHYQNRRSLSRRCHLLPGIFRCLLLCGRDRPRQNGATTSLSVISFSFVVFTKGYFSVPQQTDRFTGLESPVCPRNLWIHCRTGGLSSRVVQPVANCSYHWHSSPPGKHPPLYHHHDKDNMCILFFQNSHRCLVNLNQVCFLYISFSRPAQDLTP